MTLPFVSNRLHEAVKAAYERLIAKLEADIKKLEDDLVKERDAARNAMSSAMAFARLGDPYRGKPTAVPTPVAKPLGREGALQVLKRLESEERELLEKMKKDSNGPAPVDNAAVS